MRMHGAAIVEMDQLVLPTSLDADDGGSAQRSRTRRRQAPTQRRVEDFDLGDPATDERATKSPYSGFNLG